MYAKRYTVPSKKLAGSTVAKITKYVGLQVEKTGPRAAPIRTSPQTLFFCSPVPINLFASVLALLTNGNCSQSVGNTSTTPKPNKIPPDKYAHMDGGIAMNAVEAFRRYVKSNIEVANDPMTM
jgi:hypothetical protein